MKSKILKLERELSVNSMIKENVLTFNIPIMHSSFYKMFVEKVKCDLKNKQCKVYFFRSLLVIPLSVIFDKYFYIPIIICSIFTFLSIIYIKYRVRKILWNGQ